MARSGVHKFNSLATWLLGVPLLFLAIELPAAVKKATITPSRILRGSGSLTGGQAGQPLGLLDIKNTVSKKAERIALQFGRADLQPLNGVVGYYHVELSKNPPRLAIELPLTMGSKLDEKDVLRKLEKSKHVKKAMMSFDRVSQSTNLILQLKSPVMVRLTRVENPKAPGQLVVDLMPLKK